MRNTKKQGFTLIELLVVIAIIGILSAIGLVSLNGAREKARDAGRKSDLAQIKTAMVLYYDDHTNAYPINATLGTGVVVSAALGTAPTLSPAYLAAVPVDPKIDATHNYWYINSALGARFGLYTHLEAGAALLYALHDQGVSTAATAWPASFTLTYFYCTDTGVGGTVNLCV